MKAMVERVARAIALDLLGDEQDADRFWRGHERSAIAAIRALREPTTAMLAAAEKAWFDDPLRRTTTLWQAMIDEAMR